MKSITIKKFQYSPDVWDKVEEINIDTFKWLNTDKGPKTKAKLFYDDTALHIKFFVEQSKIEAKYKNLNEDVYKDSCVEFFVRPATDKRYINIEVNAIGTMLLGMGETSVNRASLSPDTSIFNMQTTAKDEKSYKGDMWCVEYQVPFAFFKELYGEFDVKNGFYGNFYKCGDETEYKHYGMWSEVENKTPQFHLPEFFGKINVE